jgi:hypothetical protein
MPIPSERHESPHRTRFGPYPEKQTPNGEILPSNDPKLRSLGLKVIQVFIRYPKVH